MKIELICNRCGQKFLRYRAWVRGQRRHYCSNDCRYATHGERLRQVYQERPSYRQQVAEASRRNWTPERKKVFGARVQGENNPAWRGGKIMRPKKPYRYVRCPPEFLPMARKDGYILEHRLEMARHVGRLLSRQEVIHHKNGNCLDNRIENLQLFQGNGLHLGRTLRKTAEGSPWQENNSSESQKPLSRSIRHR